MTEPKPPTPQGISALLAKAGHTRSVSTTRTLTAGYRVTVDRSRDDAVRVTQVFWPDPATPEAYQEKLDAYAETLTGAGWTVEAGEYELTVTARKDQQQ